MSLGRVSGLTHVSIRWAIGPVIVRADIAALCDRLDALLPAGADGEDDGEVVCDVSALTEPDMVAVEAMLRLQLTARRAGRRMRFSGAGNRLGELIVMSGLGLVLAPALLEPD